MDFLLVIDYIVIIAALITSALLWKEEKNASSFYLFILMLFLSLNNTLGMLIYFDEKGFFINFNVSLLIELSMYYIIYYTLIRRKVFKKIVLACFASFVLISILNWIFIQTIYDEYSNYSFAYGAFVLLGIIVLFFYEQLQDGNHKNIFKNFWFWLSAGLFVFLSTEIPIMSILNLLLSGESSAQQAIPIVMLKIIVSSSYYLTLIIAFFICRRKK